MRDPVSRLDSKGRITLPASVRKRLAAKPGDVLRYTFEGERVVIACARNEIRDDPFASFSEWYGDADERAYSSL